MYKGTAQFSPRRQSIVFNLKEDARGSVWSDRYKTIIHEAGHNIDFLAAKGNDYISTTYKDGLFVKTLKREAHKIAKPKSIDGFKTNSTKQIKELIKANYSKREYSYISDIFSGVSKNNFNLGVYHEKKYWNDDSLAKEAFTEMFSASILDKNATELIKKYFPESYNVYRDIIKEIGGKK